MESKTVVDESHSAPADQLGAVAQQLQVAVQNLQTSINQHQHKLNSKYSVDAAQLLKYAHKLAYTSFAPLGHEAGQPLPPNARPPNPQDWQFRSSQLHQFQAEWDASHRKPEPQLPPVVQPEAALQLPGNVKLPPMPAGWRPGMPIPGLEEMLLASAAAETAPVQLPGPEQQQAPAVHQQPQQAAPKADEIRKQPEAKAAPVPETTLRPAPFIPDFVLNPGLEAVEEDYSSSDYSDEEM